MKQQYFAGAGKSRIVLPEELFPTAEGFAAVHDPLYVRAFLLEGEQRILFISLELTSLPAEAAEKIQTQAARELSIPANQVWVSVTHTFSAPHICPARFIRTDAERRNNALLEASLNQAIHHAVQAAAQTTPVTLRLTSRNCDVNVNRDQELSEGWWLGRDESGCSDKRLTVLRAENAEGTVVGLLAHYAVQSSILDGSVTADGEKLVSGDLAGRAAACAEQALEAPVLFLVGAAGNQAPKRQAVTTDADMHEAGFRYVEELGDVLGQGILSAAGEPGMTLEEEPVSVQFQVCCQGQVMPDRMQLKPTRSYQYELSQPVTTPVTILRMGRLAMIGIQPELDCGIAMEIQERVPFETVLIVTMVNGSAKYMADRRSYDRFTYEARNSMFARGSAERLREEVLKRLAEGQ